MKQGWIEDRPGKRGMSYRARYWAPDGRGELVLKSESFHERQYGGKRAAKGAAEAYLAKMLTEVRAGVYIAPSDLTVGQLLDKWVNERDHEISESSVCTYASAARLLRPDVAAMPVQALKAMHLQAMFAKLRADGSAASMVDLLHTILAGALNQAVTWGLIDRNPIKAVAKSEKRPVEILYWTPEESAAFLSLEGDDVELGIAWTLSLLTGIRSGELLALRWTDVDLERMTITIWRTVTRNRKGRYHIGDTTKSRHSQRTIPLPPSCVEPLRQHRIRQRARQLAAPAWTTADGDLVLTRDDGSRVPAETARAKFAQAIARAGMRPIKMHGMRHSFATAMLIAGVHPKVVAELLGDTVEMVLRVYSHVTAPVRFNAIGDYDAKIAALRQRPMEAANTTT